MSYPRNTKMTLKEAYVKEGKPTKEQLLKMTREFPTSPLDLRLHKNRYIMQQQAEKKRNQRGEESTSRKRQFPISPLDLLLKESPLKARRFNSREEEKKLTQIFEDFPVVITDSCVSKALSASDNQREAAWDVLKNFIAEMKKSQQKSRAAGCSASTGSFVKCGRSCVIPIEPRSPGNPHTGDDRKNKLDRLSSTSLVEPIVVRRCNSMPAISTYKLPLDGAPTRSFSARTHDARAGVPPADENGFIQYYSDFPDDKQDHDTKLKKLDTLEFRFLERRSKKRKRDSDDSSWSEEESEGNFASYLPDFMRQIAEYFGLLPVRQSRQVESPPPRRKLRRVHIEYSKHPFSSCSQQ